jgi:hypothetical protein
LFARLFHSSDPTATSLPIASSWALIAGSPDPKVMGPIKRDDRPDRRLSVLTCGSGWMYAVTSEVLADTRDTPIP